MDRRWNVEEDEKRKTYIYTRYYFDPRSINCEAVEGKKENKDKWLSAMEGLYDELEVITSKRYVNGRAYYINKGKHKGRFCIIARAESDEYRNDIYFRFILNDEGENLIFIKMLLGE